MSAPTPPWTPDEDGLLRSMGAAGESANTIAMLLKRKAAGVHQRSACEGLAGSKRVLYLRARDSCKRCYKKAGSKNKFRVRKMRSSIG
jgi:hypothetical protein